MNDNAGFYEAYNSEAHGDRYNALQREADALADRIDRIEEDLENDVNHGDVVQLEKLHARMRDIEDEMELLLSGEEDAEEEADL